MSNARNLARLVVDSNGDVAASALDNVPASDDASALTTGTLDPARLPAAIDVNASAPADSLAVDSSGQIGIGTSSPGTKLEVKKDSSTAFDPSTAAFNTILTLTNTTSGASNNALLGFFTESNGEWYIGGVQNSGNTASDFVLASRASGARAERLRIDSSGRVTMPYQPAFMATKVLSQTGSGGTTFDVNFTSVQTNIGGHYNSSTNKFTAPIAGTYLFTFMLPIAKNSANYVNPRFIKNGSGVSSMSLFSNAGSGYQAFAASTVLYLNQSDYVSVELLHDNNPTADNSGNFSGYFLG